MIICEVLDLTTGEDASIWFSGGKYTALKKAILNLPEEQQDIEPGDSGVLTMTGQHKPKSAKMSGAKIYELTEFIKGPSKSAQALKAAPTESTPVAAAAVAHGPKPDYMPDAAWAVMSDEAKAQVSPPVVAPTGVVKPDAIPQAAWDLMSDDAKLAAAANF